jgi:L-iditol 2-dehydrogenase
MAKLAGADPIFITDKFPWRLKLAHKWGGIPIRYDKEDAAKCILKETHGRGVDMAIEAAWADQSVAQAAEMARLGGRLVIVGISGCDDRVELKASIARRKGLTIIMSRRMKHTYPRAIRLAESGRVDLRGLVSHRFPLKQASAAFELNTAYTDKVVKIIIQS